MISDHSPESLEAETNDREVVKTPVISCSCVLPVNSTSGPLLRSDCVCVF